MNTYKSINQTSALALNGLSRIFLRCLKERIILTGSYRTPMTILSTGRKNTTHMIHISTQTSNHIVRQDFQLAWLHHIHHNPHHWQHWVLINDDSAEGAVCLEMPRCYIIEMICDWWSFSWAKDDLTEIFRWYDEHREHMLLAKNIRETVEDILSKMAEKLNYPRF